MKRRELVLAIAWTVCSWGILAATEHTPSREVLALHVGDTIVPRYAVRTDTVLGVGPSQIIAKHCGASKIFLRLWRGTSVALSNDTVDVTVSGCSAVTPVPDVLTFAQRLPSGALVIAPPAHLTFVAGAAPSCVYVIRRTVAGVLVTGRPYTAVIADTSIAKLSADPSCPDTTVDPERIP